MDKKTTPSFSSSSVEHYSALIQTTLLLKGPFGVPFSYPQPSGKTLDFLRNLARNYRTVPQLPQGLQGIILG